MTLKLEEAVNTPNDRVPGVDWVILLKVNWVIYCNHSLLRGGFLPINSLNRERMSIARVEISYIPNISKLSDNMRVNAGSKIKVTQGTLVTVRGTAAGWDCFGKVTQEMMSFSKCSHFCRMYGLHLGSESPTIFILISVRASVILSHVFPVRFLYCKLDILHIPPYDAQMGPQRKAERP